MLKLAVTLRRLFHNDELSVLKFKTFVFVTKKQEKIHAKTHKMILPLLKALCDLFDLDRRPPEGKAAIDKETLIDRLLDFLCAPDAKLTKTANKTKSPKRGRGKSKSPKPVKKRARKVAKKVSPKKKKEKEEKEEEVESEEEEEIEEEEEEEEEEEVNGDGKKIPSDKKLRKWVKAYVNCFNLDKATTKHAIETASDKFGVDLIEKKATIKELLSEELC